jgi:hypothetical protein
MNTLDIADVSVNLHWSGGVTFKSIVVQKHNLLIKSTNDC